MYRLVVAVAVLWVFALGSQAGAAPTLSYQFRTPSDADDTVVVAADSSSALDLDIRVLLGYRVSSSQPFANASPGQCTDVLGDGMVFDCAPVPDSTEVTGSALRDSISASCGGAGAAATLVVDAGEGNDDVTSTCAATISLGPGGDGASVHRAPGTVNGGADGDDISGGNSPDVLIGDSGDDRLRGGGGDDRIEGGAGSDRVDGDYGNDTLLGGSGRDLLIGGPGTDELVGGDGIDTVSYQDRGEGAPMSISLNNAADDGAPGENDHIDASIENIIGSPGPDIITANDDSNDIDAGNGDDVIAPGAGADFIDGAGGNDQIQARDGTPDRIDCGPGSDLAITDEFDVTEGCEVVQASRELMPDVDNDGVPLPADCDDRDARRRPGLPDRPANGIDEDCDGRDAPYPRIISQVKSNFHFDDRTRTTQVRRLRVLDVPAGAQLELRCTGGRRRGCFRGVLRRRSPQNVSAVELVKLVRRYRFRARAVVELRIVRTDTIGKVVRWRMLATDSPPPSQTLCIRPGHAPQRRC